MPVRRLLTKRSDFSGRASRSEYWWGRLFLSVVVLAFTVLAAVLFPTGGGLAILVVVLLPPSPDGARSDRQPAR